MVDRRLRSMNDMFDAHIEPIPMTECWIWLGSMMTRGYGFIRTRGRYNRKNIMAHRFSYERFIGPIPHGLHLDHLCRVPLCVNPHHLEPVTCKENLYRGDLPEIWEALAIRTHCIRGHEYAGANLIISANGGRICRECKNLVWRNRYWAKKK